MPDSHPKLDDPDRPKFQECVAKADGSLTTDDRFVGTSVEDE